MNYNVYKHTNLINHKSYIGITSQKCENRWGINGKGYELQPKFYHAIQKYGWDNFQHDILYTNLDKETALKIEADYRVYLEGLWKEYAPEELKDTPLVFEEQKLRKLMTDDDREGVDAAFKDAMEQTLWERVTKTNHKDVTYYKGLLKEYTRDLLMVMREDFLEEITGHHIENKAFEED